MSEIQCDGHRVKLMVIAQPGYSLLYWEGDSTHAREVPTRSPVTLWLTVEHDARRDEEEWVEETIEAWSGHGTYLPEWGDGLSCMIWRNRGDHLAWGTDAEMDKMERELLATVPPDEDLNP